MNQNCGVFAPIRIPIPRPGDDLALYFDEMVGNDAFGLALDYSVTEFDELARLADVRVTNAEASDSGVIVHYKVYWEAFHACDDRTVTGDNARLVRGKLDGAAWHFEKAAPPAARSTLDEF